MNAEKEPTSAEVAVCKDAVAACNTCQRLLQQRAFLGMGIFAGNDIGNQTIPRIVEYKCLTRQSGRPEVTQLENAMFGTCQMVAIQNSHTIARQQRQGLRSH